MAKDTKNKPRFSLLPYRALEYLTKVREYGIEKYSGDNWDDDDISHFYEALARHALKGLEQDHDMESGLLHAAHAGVTALFIIDKILRSDNAANKKPYLIA